MKKIKKWELIKEVDVSPSKWFPLYKHVVRLPNGKVVDDYYLSKLGDVSMIVAITKNKELIFVKQYKHAAGEILLELPAGRIKDGTTAEESALMELKEETGYFASEIKSLGFMYAEPTKDTQKTHGFLVTGLETPEKQDLDENEDIEVVPVPLNKVDKLIATGKFAATDAVAIYRLAQLKHPEIFK